jgi:hypothetical protein
MMSDNLCLDYAHKNNPIFRGVLPEWHRKDVQCNTEASYKAERKTGPDVWEFRWREPDGKRKPRRMVIGRIDQAVTLNKLKAQSDVIRLSRASGSP